jgi:hypothetical protein
MADGDSDGIAADRGPKLAATAGRGAGGHLAVFLGILTLRSIRVLHESHVRATAHAGRNA